MDNSQQSPDQQNIAQSAGIIASMPEPIQPLTQPAAHGEVMLGQSEHAQQPLHSESVPKVLPEQHVAEQLVHQQELTMNTQVEQVPSHRVAQLQQESLAGTSGGSTVPPSSSLTQKKHDIPEERSMLPLMKIFIGVAVFFIIGGGLLWFILSFMSHGVSQKIILQYWGLWEESSVMQSIITDFERINPNIIVQYTKQDPTDYTRRLLTRIENGTGPDIFRYQPSWIPMLQPILLPLPESVIAKQEFTKNYYPVMQQDLIKNGAIYGIPLGIDTLALFTNDDIFKKTNQQIPANWTDFITVSRALTTKDSSGKIQIAGAAIGTYDNILHAPDIISLLFLQNGVNMANLSATAKNVSDAVTFYTSFAKQDSSNVWDNTLDPSGVAFAKGNVGMFFGYSWDIFTIKALNPNLSFHISLVPHLPGRNMTVSSYWAEGVSEKSKYPKETLLFMKYLTQKDTLQKLFTEESKTRLFGELYPRVDMADLLKNNSLVAPFIAQASTAQSSLFVGETKDQAFNAPMNQYVGNTINSVLSGTSAQTAVDTLTSGVNQILQQYAPKKTQ